MHVNSGTPCIAWCGVYWEKDHIRNFDKIRKLRFYLASLTRKHLKF